MMQRKRGYYRGSSQGSSQGAKEPSVAIMAQNRIQHDDMHECIAYPTMGSLVKLILDLVRLS